jgi:hypothetical protein
MHCAWCDKMLTEAEISWNKDIGSWEPCAKCLEVAMDAAYRGDFIHDEDVELGELDAETDGTVPIVDAQTEDFVGGETSGFTYPGYDPEDYD